MFFKKLGISSIHLFQKIKGKLQSICKKVSVYQCAPLPEEWVNEMCCICTRDCYWALKRMPQYGYILKVLNGISQSQKRQTLHDSTSMRQSNSQKEKKRTVVARAWAVGRGK